MTNYIDEYKKLHSTQASYGTSACMYLEEVCLIIEFLKPKTILDYGCGKAVLIKALRNIYPDIKFYGYDPAIEDKNILPIQKADLLINTDVLEHIPQKELPFVLEKISSISKNAFFALHHALACAILPNGENAHCTVKPYEWYYDLLKNYYETPYPLNGAKPEHSAMITFSPSIDFLEKYDAIISIKKSKNLAPDKKTKKISRFIGKIICLFIPKKKNRKHFREKYFCTK